MRWFFVISFFSLFPAPPFIIHYHRRWGCFFCFIRALGVLVRTTTDNDLDDIIIVFFCCHVNSSRPGVSEASAARWERSFRKVQLFYIITTPMMMMMTTLRRLSTLSLDVPWFCIPLSLHWLTMFIARTRRRFSLPTTTPPYTTTTMIVELLHFISPPLYYGCRGFISIIV